MSSGGPGSLPVRMSRLLTAIGLMFAGTVLSGAAAWTSVRDPLVRVPPEPTRPPTTQTTTPTQTTTETPTTTPTPTTQTATETASPPGQPETGPDQGGAGTENPGNVAPTQFTADLKLNPRILELILSGTAANLIALLTALTELTTARRKARTAERESKS